MDSRHCVRAEPRLRPLSGPLASDPPPPPPKKAARFLWLELANSLLLRPSQITRNAAISGSSSVTMPVFSGLGTKL